MTVAVARARAAELYAALRDHGVQASVELQIGRPNTAGDWGDAWYTRKIAIVNHHTGGPATGLTPSLAVCKRGRSDLIGPLCNSYGGRDLVHRIVTMGLANHPGAGGPMVVGGFRIPKDSARLVTWGIEYEHDGKAPWSDEMREFMARSGAAILDFFGLPASASIEHKSWAPGRKSDRNTYNAALGAAEISKYMARNARVPALAAKDLTIMDAATRTYLDGQFAALQASGLNMFASLSHGTRVDGKTANGNGIDTLLAQIVGLRATVVELTRAITAVAASEPAEAAALSALPARVDAAIARALAGTACIHHTADGITVPGTPGKI